MSSVQDPLQRIQSLHCGVKAIVVDGVIDENVIQSVAQTFDESCVVILHIGDSNVVGLKGIYAIYTISVIIIWHLNTE